MIFHNKHQTYEEFLKVSLTVTAFLHQLGAKMNSSTDSTDYLDPADPAYQVSSTAARSLPSTRAGGQDDVSLNKLPQMKSNVLKTHIFL